MQGAEVLAGVVSPYSEGDPSSYSAREVAVDERRTCGESETVIVLCCQSEGALLDQLLRELRRLDRLRIE